MTPTRFTVWVAEWLDEGRWQILGHCSHPVRKIAEEKARAFLTGLRSYITPGGRFTKRIRFRRYVREGG